MDTTISTRIDFPRKGEQIGTLNLPYLPDDDAYGFIPISIAVIANGEDPTVLITGGVHRDEYEDPIVLNDLIRSRKPEQVHGRLIFMPVRERAGHQGGRADIPRRSLQHGAGLPRDGRIDFPISLRKKQYDNEH